MQIERKNLPKSRVRLEIEYPAEQMADAFTQAVRSLGQDIELEGFRKGKAPESLIRERLGQARITSEAIELALPRAYQEALDKEELIPVEEPKVEIIHIAEGDAFKFVAEVDTLPVVGIPKLEKIRVDAKKHAPKKVEEADIDEALTNLRRRFATPKIVERTAIKGDWVEVSYSGTIDGVVQENLTSSHHPVILGEGTFLSEFEDQLVGMAAGEKKVFTINVPGPDSKSRPAEFTVTVDQISEIILPEMNDELAKRFGKTDAADLRSAIADDLMKHHESEARAGLEQAVLAELEKQSRVELPESLVEREIHRRVHVLTEQMQMAGRKFEDWLKDQKKDLEGFRKEIRPAAESAVKTSLVLRAVAEQEGQIQAGEPATEESLKTTVDLLVDRVTK